MTTVCQRLAHNVFSVLPYSAMTLLQYSTVFFTVQYTFIVPHSLIQNLGIFHTFNTVIYLVLYILSLYGYIYYLCMGNIRLFHVLLRKSERIKRIK